MSNGYTKSWHSKKPGWLQKSSLRLDRIAISDGFGPDATAFPAVVNFMEQIGEGIAAIVPKKSRGTRTKLVGVTFKLPAEDAETCFALNVSPDMDGLDGNKIWDVFRSIERPRVRKYTTLTMWFGLWE